MEGTTEGITERKPTRLSRIGSGFQRALTTFWTNAFTRGLRQGLGYVVSLLLRLLWVLFRWVSLVLGGVLVIFVLLGFLLYSLNEKKVERFVSNFGMPAADEKAMDLLEKDKPYFLRFDLNRLADSWFVAQPLFTKVSWPGKRIGSVTLIHALEHAADNDKVKGLVVTMDESALSRLGVSQLQEARNAIIAFRANGKPTWIYADSLGGLGGGGETGMTGYYFASAFDSITLAPSGALGLSGVRIEVPYFRKVLDKYEILPEFHAREAYKSAPESFMQERMSAEVQENLQSLADTIMRRWRKDVEHSRRISGDAVNQALQKAHMSATEALSRGFIDRNAYRDEFYKAFRAAVGVSQQSDEEDKGKGGIKGVPLSLYAASYELGDFRARGERWQGDAHRKLAMGSSEDSESEEGDEPKAEEEEEEEEAQVSRVAVLSLHGPITRTSAHGGWEGGQCGGDRWGIAANRVASLLRRLGRDDRFQALVIYIESPGGDYIGSDLIYRAIQQFRSRSRKPVAVVMGSVAASGGYFIAMTGEHVFVQPFAVTGSIGVFSGKVATRGFWRRWGVEWSVVQSGSSSTLHSTLDPYSEKDLQVLAESLDSIYGDFKGKVASSRGLDLARVDSLAGGRIWLGEQAVANGLADSEGGYEQARAWMAERLSRPVQETIFLPYPQSSFSRQLLQKLCQFGVEVAAPQWGKALGTWSKSAQDVATRVKAMRRPQGVLTMPPILVMP